MNCEKCGSEMKLQEFVYTSDPVRYGYKCPKCGNVQYSMIKEENNQMDYEKKYKNALECARQEYNTTENVERKQWLEELFPELKESEDKKIRKALVDALNKNLGNGIEKYGTTLNAALAWLEKQCYTKKDIDDAYLKGICDTKHELEKQGEQKPVIDFKAKNWYVSKVDGKIHDMTYNPTDKVEPKFKVGDWIVDNHGIVNQVTSTTDDGYGLALYDGTYVSGCWKDYYHLWTIQDAKDGDVIVDKYNNIGIFKECKDIYWLSHIYLGCDGELRGFNVGPYHEQDDTHPATKEQRATLFAKMQEYGYQWDAEKKELKKINSYCQENCKGYQETGKCFADGGCDAKRKAEQKSEPAWSDEDEGMKENIEGALDCYESMVTEDWEKEKEWLKSLKDKITWKPSEEQMDALLGIMIEFGVKYIDYNTLESLYNDLKKL